MREVEYILFTDTGAILIMVGAWALVGFTLAVSVLFAINYNTPVRKHKKTEIESFYYNMDEVGVPQSFSWKEIICWVDFLIFIMIVILILMIDQKTSTAPANGLVQPWGEPHENLSKVMAVVGPSTSTKALTVAPLLMMNHIPMHFNWRWVAFLYIDDDYGNNGLELFLKKIENTEICLAYNKGLNTNTNHSQIFKQINAQGIGAIIVFALKWTAEALIVSAINQNVTNKVWIASDAWSLNKNLPKKKGIRNIGTVIGLLAELKKSNFTLLNQSIRFDENGDPDFGSYSVVFWNHSDKAEEIGIHDFDQSAKLFINNSKIKWHIVGEVPTSVCSEECPVGFVKKFTGTHKCCFDCEICPSGSYVTRNTTEDPYRCIDCKDTEWSAAGSTSCNLREVEYIPFTDTGAILIMLGAWALVGFTLAVSVLFAINYNTPVAKAITFCLLLLILTWILFATTFVLYHGKYIPILNALAILSGLYSFLMGARRLSRSASLSGGYLNSNFGLAICRCHPQTASSAFAEKAKFPSFLRTVHSNKEVIDLIFNIVKHFNWRWVAFLNSDDAYGIDGLELFYKRIKDTEICLAYNKGLNDDTNDTEIFKEIEVQKINTIIVFAPKMTAEALIESAVRLNVTNRVWIAGDTWSLSTKLHKMKGIKNIGTVIGVSQPVVTIPEDPYRCIDCKDTEWSAAGNTSCNLRSVEYIPFTDDGAILIMVGAWALVGFTLAVSVLFAINYNTPVAKAITFCLLLLILTWIAFATEYMLYHGKYIPILNALAILS
ncbi:hypothetical protein NQZ68_000470, partial [Dissostichus eleginoides]